MKTLTAILTVLAAAPALAAETFALPPGCDGYVTVQKRGCIVSHLFTCESDPAGHQRRADLSDEGMMYLGLIDAETQWLESYHVAAGHTDRLGPVVRDAASFTDLLETGRDSFDFETSSDLYGITRYVGGDELTGVVEVIDGVELMQTIFDVIAYDAGGAELWRVAGQEYIQPEWRTFVSGRRIVSSENGVSERDNTPVEFIFPGEQGFLARRPLYDCSVVLGGLEPLR